MDGNPRDPNAIPEPILDDVSWTNAKGPHRSGCPFGDLLDIFMGPDGINGSTRCSWRGAKLCPFFRGCHGVSSKMRMNLLFLTKFCLCNKGKIGDIVQGSNIIRLDACLLELLSIEFRISMTSSYLEFEFMELQGLQFFSVHRLHFRIEIFSNLHRSPLSIADCGIRNAE